MKTRTIVASLAVAAAATFGVAGTALAQSDTTPTTAAADAPAKGARKEFVCGHQDQIKDLQAQHKALIASRLSLLKQARQAAVDAGASKLVVKIDNRIAAQVKAQDRVEARTQRFTTWVGANCTG